MKKPELILPAGDFEKLTYALAYGADAVYAGIPETSLRARSNGFDIKLLQKAVDYCHERGKKIYITVNIYAHEDDLADLPRLLAVISEFQPDAFIVSDPGVLRLIFSLGLQIPIHLSTQANTTNSESVLFWLDQGVKRIILARELSFSDIERIRKRAPDAELEIFIHGALCISYSGRCLLSNFLAGRDANRGECAGSCRWRYTLIEDSRRDEYFAMEEDEHGSYILNSKDLCLIDSLDRLKVLELDGYKVEGRTKNIFYLALIGMAYRAKIDAVFDDNISSILQHVPLLASLPDNHGFTRGFLFGDDGIMQRYNDTDRRGQRVAGLVRGLENDLVRVEVKNPVSIGDRMLGISPGAVMPITVHKIIWEGRKIQTAYGARKQVVLMEVEPKLEDGKWDYGIIAKSITE